jgi:hypothetical protein
MTRQDWDEDVNEDKYKFYLVDRDGTIQGAYEYKEDARDAAADSPAKVKVTPWSKVDRAVKVEWHRANGVMSKLRGFGGPPLSDYGLAPVLLGGLALLGVPLLGFFGWKVLSKKPSTVPDTGAPGAAAPTVIAPAPTIAVAVPTPAAAAAGAKPTTVQDLYKAAMAQQGTGSTAGEIITGISAAADEGRISQETARAINAGLLYL